MKAEGIKTEDIAKFVVYGKLAVYSWFRQYKIHGIDGLREKGGRGPNPLMNLDDLESVKKAIGKSRTGILAERLQHLLLAWRRDRIKDMQIAQKMRQSRILQRQ